MPEISVVLPVYNGQRYLERAIKSITGQQFKDFELIIVNDCSTDDSLAIAEAMASKDERIKIISNHINKRLPYSLNIGFNAANGEYFTWTSDDNILKTNCLSTLLHKLKKNNADIIYADAEEVDDDDKFLLVRRRNSPLQNLAFENIVGACFLYRREVHKRLCGFKENLFLIEDYDFWLRSWLNNFSFVHTDDVLYTYRRHDKSLSKQFERKALFIKLKYIIKMRLCFTDKNILKTVDNNITKMRNFFYFQQHNNTDNLAKILESDPFNLYNHFINAYNNISNCNIKSAKEILSDILDIIPTWIDGYFLYSYCYELEKNFDMAIKVIQQGLVIEKDNFQLRKRLLHLLKIKISLRTP